MDTMPKKRIRHKISTLLLICFLFSANMGIQAQVPDPNQGLRADWMRGAWGALWLPETCYNGKIEGVTIDDFLTQIKDIRTIDYVQIGLTNPNIFSPVHTAPNAIIESLWQGDTDSNGNPINLVVPRASRPDPFSGWLKALRAAGLRTEVYVNSYNLLARIPDNIPTGYPDLSARWKAYCDTNPTVQTFINNNPYLNPGNPEDRKYMFCYAEFILKEYAVRYGDLIDAWCFDSADNIMEACGDNAGSGVLDDQRIYGAFANAVHSGNPNAAIAFNNSVGDRVGNPFTTATLFDDYTFGHPFGGAGNMVENETLYNYNHHVVEFMQANNGYAFRDDTRDWNDNVVGHFFPKQSTTSWNSGNTPCLTDDQFVEWTSTGIINGGAITWGTPLVRVNLANSPVLTLQPYALAQLTKTDDYLKQFQSPGAPNWARQRTILPPAYIGMSYTHTLTEGFDFWDPEGDAITSLIALDNFPSWLTITETEPGVWTLSGTPTEAKVTDYQFGLRVSDASGGTDRAVDLSVLKDFVPEPITLDVQIKATATTNYGINTIATMYSEVQTAPDGKATFRVSIDIVPPSDKAMISGISGGTSTVNSWGLGDGTDSNQDDIFRGSDNEWVESINNIQIIDFNANGGSLTTDDITATFFKSITIMNAQSTNDFVSLKVGGTTANPGKSANQIETIDLESATFASNITDFSIGTGNTSTTNKWSVEGITVKVVFNGAALAVEDIVQDNKSSFKLYPNPAKGKISLNINPVMTQFFDITGKIVKIDTEGKKELDVSALNKGIYIIKVQNADGKVFFKKLLKE